MRHAARRHAAGAALLMTLGSGAARASTTPGRAVVLDAFADPFGLGHFGALFEAAPLAIPSSSATPLSSSAVFYQPSDLAFRSDGSIVVVDREADPSGFGADANGDHGAGAVLLADSSTQALSVLADGSDFPAGLPPATSSIFVEPIGIAITLDGRILLVDQDADPSQLGLDSAGFAGHGALFEVSASGAVTLLSDGTLSDDGPPPLGAASWFEDPGAIAVASDGSVHVLDRFGDPLAVGGRGAVYGVDLATGRIRLEAVSASFAGPAFIAEWQPGMLLVSDQLARPLPAPARGALFRIDLAQADPTLATSLLVADPRFRGPAGMGRASDGSVFVADPFSDPLALGRLGGIFRLKPDDSLGVASSAPEFLAPSSVRVVPPVAAAPTLLTIDPAFAEVGESLTVTLGGTDFAGPAELRLGPGVAVSAVRVMSPSAAEADIVVDALAPLGPHDAVLVNEDLQPGLLAGGFQVRPRTQPQVLTIDPAAAIQGTSTGVTVTGARFTPGASLDLGAGVSVANVVVPDQATLTADVTVDPGAPPGPHDVVVTNADATTGRLVGGFEVLQPAPPQPSAVTPAQLVPDQDADIAVDGSGFVAGCTFDLGADVEEGPALVLSPFSARLRVHVRAGAPAGPRDVMATNPDLRAGTLPSGVAISGPALRILGARLDDTAGDGNGNGALDPGETVALDIGAYNAGAAAATGLVLRISDAAPGTGLTLVRGAVTFPDIAAGARARRPAAPYVEIHLDAAAGCGDRVSLDVELVQANVVVARRRMTLGIGRIVGWGRKPALDGDVAGGRRGDAVGLADLDGDGVADILVGAPRESPAGLFAAGRVIAVAGRGDDVLWQLDGDETDGRLGASLCGVGDVDGDGHEDVLVGSPGARAGAGRLLLVSGLDGSLIEDRVGDPGDALGGSVAWLGDRDLDGRPEAMAGAPRAQSDAGAAVILTLPDLDERERLRGAASERLGASLAAGGDLDGDGRMDGVVGAPAGPAGGRAVAWLSAGPSVDAAVGMPGDRLGATVALGADLDEDGVADILVGAPGASSNAGRVEAISGRSLAALRTLPGIQAGAEAGTAVAFGPDLDSDGVAELVVGSPGLGSDDGLIEMRSGSDGRLLGFEAGASGEGGRFGERLFGARDASGDAFADFIAGAPEHGAVVPRSGRGMAMKALIACSLVTPCTPDALEPNPPGAPAPVGIGRVDDLSICSGDVDAFLLTPAPSRRVAAVVRFAHAMGDLDVTLHDAASGSLVESSLSLDDDEEIGPIGPGGPYELRVFGYDGARNTYALIVVDPDACPVASPVAGVRASKAGGRFVLGWDPSADPCHAPPPMQGYRVWKAPSPAPVGAPGPFPTGTAFVDASSSDQDGDPADERFIEDIGGAGYYLVTDRGRSGEDGPATP